MANSDKEIIERVREDIAEIKLSFGIGGCKIGKHYADQILSIKNVAIIDSDAELPKYKSSRFDGSSIAQYEMRAINKAQQDMLKAGWVKMVKDEN